MNPKTRQQLAALKTASPLQMAGALKEMELYDKKTAQEIIDEVYEKYATGQNLQDEVVEPVFLSVLDGLLEKSKWGRQARKKGLTASRVISECRTFAYDAPTPYAVTNDGYVDYKNMQEYRGKYGDERGDYTGKRKNIENKYAMDKYKNEKFKENDGKNAIDEYTGEKNITLKRDDPDKRRSDETHRYQAQTDHIEPLEKVYNRLKDNYALSDDDIRAIANGYEDVNGKRIYHNYNFALTSAKINQEKLQSTNTEYVEKYGENNSPETNNRMIDMEKKAVADIENAANKVVGRTVLFNGNATREERKQAYKEECEKIGRKLTKEERAAIDSRLAKEKGLKVWGNAAGDAVTQQGHYMVGNVILYIVKPLYYELSDIVKNGLKDGVGVDSFKDAMRIRFGRVKAYVVDNAKNFMGENVKDFVKGFVSSLIEGIIGLFVGVWRNFLKLCKEGVRMLSSSWKIVKGEEGKKLSSAEKKQAIAKIIGTGVIAVAGIAFEEWLSAHIGREWSVIISTMMSGIAATLFFYFLNKADLFSVKVEQRHARIEEIFNERIKEIETTAKSMNTTALETMCQQREEFENVCDGIEEGLANDDIDKIGAGWYRMAEFLHVELPYHDTDSFVEYMDRMRGKTIFAESSAK